MKFLLILCFGILIITNISFCTLLRNSANIQNEIVVGSASNDDKGKSIDAITYGYNEKEKTDSLDPFKEHITTINPKIVQHLIKETIEKVNAEAEIIGDKSDKSYYDGTINIKANNQECGFYSKRPQECLTNSHCGWCNKINQCVLGNRYGPAGNSCNKESFIYFSPDKDWDPLNQKNNNSQSRSFDSVTYK